MYYFVSCMVINKEPKIDTNSWYYACAHYGGIADHILVSWIYSTYDTTFNLL